MIPILSQENLHYATYHKKRFDFLLQTLARYTGKEGGSRILEIGRGPFTRRLAERFPRQITTLGYPIAHSQIANIEHLSESEIPHLIFDLTDCLTPEKWIQGGPFDVILFTEVLEHLYINAHMVFLFLRSLLSPTGVLICQTPNFANLNNRVKVLLGQNPIRMYGPNLLEPGHFREFTRAELITIGTDVGLQVTEHHFQNYFGSHHWATACFDCISAMIPPLRRGQTIVYQNTPAKGMSAADIFSRAY